MQGQSKTSAEPSDLALRPTSCPICGTAGNAAELYPANFAPRDLNPAIFSARRLPDRLRYRLVRCNDCRLVRSDPVAAPTPPPSQNPGGGPLWVRKPADAARRARPPAAAAAPPWAAGPRNVLCVLAATATVVRCGDGLVVTWGIGETGELARPVCALKARPEKLSQLFTRRAANLHTTPIVFRTTTKNALRFATQMDGVGS